MASFESKDKKDDKTESNFAGYGIGSIILIINKNFILSIGHSRNFLSEKMLRHHLKARTIKEDEKESDIVGYGIGSII